VFQFPPSNLPGAATERCAGLFCTQGIHKMSGGFVVSGCATSQMLSGRIFGLDGRESYRKLRLELLCCTV